MGDTLEPSISTISWPTASKPCDICKSATALLFCRHDSAFLCMACDSNVHKTLTLRHEKVWVCEVCEQAPASVNCKADAASLCVKCDFDIHSANPLSRRHERTPVVPFFDMAELVLRSTTSALLLPMRNDMKTDPCFGNGDLVKSSTDSWVSSDLSSTVTYCDEKSEVKSMEFLISEYDQLLESGYHISRNDQFKSGSDSVVPVQNMILPISADQFLHRSPESCFEIDFTRSCINSYNMKSNFTTPSHSHGVSSSSMEVGVVPDGVSISEVSYSYGRCMSSSIDLNESGGGGNQASQFPGMDREARVLRYREKRKNRKFQKTIRYASRKTYAETRPRIKGRFAKRTEIDDCGIDQYFGTVSSSDFSITDSKYNTVPLM